VLIEICGAYRDGNVNEVNEGGIDRAFQCQPSLLISSMFTESSSADQVPITPSDRSGLSININ
jgi:hypothetical protein